MTTTQPLTKGETMKPQLKKEDAAVLAVAPAVLWVAIDVIGTIVILKALGISAVVVAIVAMVSAIVTGLASVIKSVQRVEDEYDVVESIGHKATR